MLHYQRREFAALLFLMFVHSSFTIFKIILPRLALRMIQVVRLRATRMKTNSKRIHLTSKEKKRLGFITRSFDIATYTRVKYLNRKPTARVCLLTADSLAYLGRNNQ